MHQTIGVHQQRTVCICTLALLRVCVNELGVCKCGARVKLNVALLQTSPHHAEESNIHLAAACDGSSPLAALLCSTDKHCIVTVTTFTLLYICMHACGRE